MEITGPPTGRLDDPLVFRTRGAGPQEGLVWRARMADDDGRVWRATAGSSEGLSSAWVPAKAQTGEIAALGSLRAVSIELRVEAPDGQAASRSVIRSFAGEGVQSRRWRDGLVATLHLPATRPVCATVIIDGQAGDNQALVAAFAGPLLASRGVLALVVTGASRGTPSPAEVISAARERLAAVPDAGDPQVLPAMDPFKPTTARVAVVLAPGIGVRDSDAAIARRAEAWDSLLAGLGAEPRSTEPGSRAG